MHSDPNGATVDQRFVDRLMSVETLMQREESLEECLQDLACLAAESIAVDRCSVMLLADDGEDRRLKVLSHYGDLPSDAYRESVPLDGSIAGHVVVTGESLLINDIARSPFSHLARHGERSAPGLMSAPIRAADTILGAINASAPRGREVFTERDRDLLQVFALFVGKSIQAFELRKLAHSRLLQMAQSMDRRQDGLAQTPICPDPNRLAKLVAKTIYRELAGAGFGPSAIIAVSSQVLSELNEHLGRHRARLERQRGAAEEGE